MNADKNFPPSTSERLLITGIGLVTPFGTGREPFATALKEGRIGYRSLVDVLDVSTWPVRVGGWVPEVGPEQLGLFHNKLRGMGKYVRLGILAAQQALADAGIVSGSVDPTRIGAFVASGTNGQNAEGLFPAFDLSRDKASLQTESLDLRKLGAEGIDRVHPWWLLGTISNNLIFFVTHVLGLKGPNSNVCNSAIAGASMIDRAMESLRQGELDVALVGGADTPLNWQMISDLSSLGVLAEGTPEQVLPLRPFGGGSQGTILSDGAGFLVIERESFAKKRGRNAGIQIVDTAFSGSFLDPVAPSSDGVDTRMVTESLLEHVEKNGLVQVNTSAMGLPNWDSAELLGLISAAGTAGSTRRLAIGAAKHLLGHTWSISFILETIASAIALEEGFGLVLPPNSPASLAAPLARAPQGRFDHSWALNLGQCFGGATAGALLHRL
ncbi:MAG: beta-ketoacyl synthase N-terminal-like domain-containing protein [Candidatus Ozemobacteraceae bacterium]